MTRPSELDAMIAQTFRDESEHVEAGQGGACSLIRRILAIYDRLWVASGEAAR